MSAKVHGPHGTVSVRASEGEGRGVEVVEEGVPCGIPEHALRAVVFQRAEGEIQVGYRMVVGPLRGVVGVAAARRVRHWPLPNLLHSIVLERLAVAVLAEPHLLRLAVQKPDHVVLPVADVVAEFLVQDCVALVVGVEVHVEGVDTVVAVVVDDDCAAGGVGGLAGGVGDYAVEPFGLFGDVDGGCEVDVHAIAAESVEKIEVVEGEW